MQYWEWLVFDISLLAFCKLCRCVWAGFKKKEFRGKLAIAITANFINHNTKEEAIVEEISGVSYIFNQKFVIHRLQLLLMMILCLTL